MLKAAELVGMNLFAHRSRLATAEEIDAADLVFVMDWKNYSQLVQLFPQAVTKTTFLGLFSKSGQIEIEDPYELSGQRLEKVIATIGDAVAGLGSLVAPAMQPREVGTGSN